MDYILSYIDSYYIDW